MVLLSDDERMLQDTAASFLAAAGGPAKQLRHWRDSRCKDGFGHELWGQFADLGLTGICISEAHGGLGLGLRGAALVLEEIGRNLTPSPFLTTAVAGARALEGSSQGDQWLPRIAAGEAVLALGVDEGAHHAPLDTAMQATRRGNGFLLEGEKQFVVHGGSADLIITAARTGGAAGQADGITLFAVSADRDGVAVENVTLADSSKAARLRFEAVEVDADSVIGEVDRGWPRLSRALAAGRTGASAELVGLASGASAMTLDYLKQRKQFGRLIGEFQALQHRSAHLYGEIEIARAATLKAADLVDRGDDNAELMVSVAKAKSSAAASLAVSEAVQMHGGIGMTDEHDAGLYMKREAVLSQLFGDVFYHRERVAQISGY
jgi:alkylation response protein AidB-like acyl-CoA dehydrogenase